MTEISRNTLKRGVDPNSDNAALNHGLLCVSLASAAAGFALLLLLPGVVGLSELGRIADAVYDLASSDSAGISSDRRALKIQAWADTTSGGLIA